MKRVLGVLMVMGLLFGVQVDAEPLVEGRVRLASGEPAVGAQVLLFDLTNLRAAPIAATTDETGYFALPFAALSGASALPEQFEIGQNYPNPFNPSTIIPYRLPTAMPVRLEIFDALGQRIASLVDGERAAGFHTARWDATDAAGRAVAAGVYFYRLSGGGIHLTRSMVLIDGQAGVPAAGAGGSVAAPEETLETGSSVYGLTVSGRGLVPYVDPAFRVAVDRGPVDLVVETLGSTPRAKVAVAGVLGDVDNNGRVDIFDALLVAVYSANASIVMPNNGDIALGDVNRDGLTDLTDAYLIATYSVNPSDPVLPVGIGAPVGPAAASLSPDPSTVTFADDEAWHRFTVQAGESVVVVANPGATAPRVEITTRSGQPSHCPAEADDDHARQDGEAIYLAGCAAGTGTVELRRASDQTVLQTYTFTVGGSPDLLVESPSVSDSSPDAGASFTLSVTVRNQGNSQSASTTLHYYRSTNTTISTSDTLVGTDAVSSLAASDTSAESISVTAPSSAGTYYYGTCVESVSGESDTGNNCSGAVTVTVGGGDPSPGTASLSPDPSTVTFAADGAWHQFTVQASESVVVVANPGVTAPRVEITTGSGRSNYCPAEADDDHARQDGEAIYLAGCATGTGYGGIAAGVGPDGPANLYLHGRWR